MALMRGTAYWTKILGKPLPGYTEGDKALAPKEWSMDFTPDADGLAAAKLQGFTGKLKNKGDERGQFIHFTRGEFKAGGNEIANQPIPVVDHHGKPWDRKVLIGNGSTVNVKYSVYEGRKGNKPILLAVQVWNLIPYVGKPQADFPVKDEFPATEASTEVA